MVVTVDYLVNATESTLFELDESYRLASLTITPLEGWLNDSYLETVSEINDVSAVAGFIKVIDRLHLKNFTVELYIYGSPPNPMVDTIPGVDWGTFNNFSAIIDEGLAEELKLKVGDTVNLLGYNFSVDYIKAIVWGPSLKYSYRASIVVPINTLYRILNISNVYNEVRVRAKDLSVIPVVAYDVYTLSQNMGYLVNVHIRPFGVRDLLSNLEPILFISRFIAVSIIVLTTTFFSYIDIKSRSRELGVLRSIGFSKFNIFILYLTQMLLLIVLAIILSMFVGLQSAFYVIRDISYLPGIRVVINPFSFSAIRDLIIGILAILISATLTLSRVNIRPLNELIKFGDIDVSSTYPSRLKTRFFKLNFNLRVIISKKVRSLAIILLISLAVALSGAFIILYSQSKAQSLEIYSKTFRWDISVVLEEPVNETIISEVQNIDGVALIEPIIMMQLPVINIASNSKRITPPYNRLALISVNGNESMIKFNFTEGTLGPGLIITEKIKKILNVDLGERVSIRALHPYGSVIGTDLTIVGIVDTNLFGGWIIILQIGFMENLLLTQFGLEPGFNMLLIKKAPYTSSYELVKNIEEFLENKGLRGRVSEKSRVIKSVYDYYGEVNKIITAIITVLLIGVSLSVTLIWLIEMYNRKWEIALYKSLGMDLKHVINLLIIESLILSTISIFVSVPLTLIALKTLTDALNGAVLDIWIKTHYNPAILTTLYIGVFLVPIIIHSISVTITYIVADQKMLNKRD